MADERDEAIQTYWQLEQDINRVGGDTRLTKQALYDGVQALYDTARGKIDQLRAAFWQRVNGERQRLMQSLMAPNWKPAGATTAEAEVAGQAMYLDALDRAGKAAEKDGATGVRRLLTLAGNIGNKHLEQACFCTALENLEPEFGTTTAWDAVINEFLGRYPAFASDVDALRRLIAADGSPQWKMQVSMYFSCKKPLMLVNPRPTIYAG
jgi:hypothetical protein